MGGCVWVGATGDIGSDGAPLVSYDAEVKSVSIITHDLKGRVGGMEKWPRPHESSDVKLSRFVWFSDQCSGKVLYGKY